jgi:hypothetical protein
MDRRLALSCEAASKAKRGCNQQDHQSDILHESPQVDAYQLDCYQIMVNKM